MDYSGGAGTSPWASSPEASRTSFSNENVPRADLPGPAVREEEEGRVNGEEQQHQHGYTGQTAYAAPGQGQGSWSPEQQHQWQQQQAGYQQQGAQQQQQQYEGQRASHEEGRRPQSARYHGMPSQQRQHVPQYKLQAKITGLERAGKKDPILKFDVYVCSPQARLADILTDISADEPPEVQDDTVPRCPTHTLRVHQAIISPHGFQSGSSGACGPSSVDKCWDGHR